MSYLNHNRCKCDVSQSVMPRMVHVKTGRGTELLQCPWAWQENPKRVSIGVRATSIPFRSYKLNMGRNMFAQQNRADMFGTPVDDPLEHDPSHCICPNQGGASSCRCRAEKKASSTCSLSAMKTLCCLISHKGILIPSGA